MYNFKLGAFAVNDCDSYSSTGYSTSTHHEIEKHPLILFGLAISVRLFARTPTFDENSTSPTNGY